MHRDEAAQLAAIIVRFRQIRAAVFPSELFSEPAWDLLMVLFIADADGRRMTGRAACAEIGTAHAVMSRWLKHLSAIGLLVGDGVGNLDDPLTLSGAAFDKMEHVLAEAKLLRDSVKA